MSGTFSNTLVLKQIPNSVYRPKKLSGAVCEHMSCTFLLLSIGSFVCLGAKKKKDGLNSSQSMACILNVTVASCCIKNMVMSGKLVFCIDLEKLNERLREMTRFVTSESELFNGIVWKGLGGTVRLFYR